MMRDENNTRNFVSEAFTSLFGVTLVVGLSLFMLGILIFAYPQLIGLLVAAFLLVVAGIVLYAAWQFWRIKREVKAVQNEWMVAPKVEDVERRPYVFRRITWIVR
ncbi:MAG: hypothetical protein KC553_12045 [Nitrospina sp.]|nr:hypothetical protein [Nitrospina sp.]